MAATINPCGFALLPAYLAAFVGLDDHGSKTGAVARALSVSAVLTAGFVTVFGLFGAVITKAIGGVQEYLPWATIVIGVGLVGLGIYLLTGRELVLDIPKLQRGGADGTLLSMYLFGISYAVASLSCTIGPFLAVTSTTFRNESYLSGVLVFVLYGVGMGIVVGVLTVAVALAKDGIVAKFRSLIPKMNKIAGGLLVIAGAYVAYYGYYEVRIFHFDGPVEDPVVDAASDVQQWLLQFVPEPDDVWKYIVGAVVVIGAAMVWSWSRSRRVGPTAEEPRAEPVPDADVTA
jgi:cytochrome c biogenesis protein CcdA